MELSKEDARAIWLQKYYFRDRFEFNYYVLEYPLPKKLSNIKNRLLFQMVVFILLGLAFNQKRNMTILLIYQVLTGIFSSKNIGH